MASKTKTSGFWTTCPPQYHSVKRHAYLRQIGDSEASTRTVCTQAEVRWQSSGNWLDSLAKLCHVVIFGGSVLWFGEPQITNLTIVWGHARAITKSVPYSHVHMIRDGSLMESFAGLLQRLVVLWASRCFVEVDARFRGVLPRNTNIDTGRKWFTNTPWKGHQMPIFSIPKRPLCSWKVLCAGMISNGGKSTWKFDDFTVS